jgi:hypothetical protein
VRSYTYSSETVGSSSLVGCGSLLRRLFTILNALCFIYSSSPTATPIYKSSFYNLRKASYCLFILEVLIASFPYKYLTFYLKNLDYYPSFLI